MDFIVVWYSAINDNLLINSQFYFQGGGQLCVRKYVQCLSPVSYLGAVQKCQQYK
jgi:hypothetical protein